MKSLGFPGGLVGKESICNVGDLGSSLDWEDLLEKGKGSHSSILTCRIPLMVYSPWGRKESDMTEHISTLQYIKSLVMIRNKHYLRFL